MNPGISIWNRLLGVMMVMLIVIGGFFVWQSRSNEKANEEILRSAVAQRQAHLSRVNRLISRSLESFTINFGRYPISAMPSAEVIEEAALDARVDFVAILNADKSLAFSTVLKGSTESEAFLPPHVILQYLTQENQNALFFTLTPRGPMQCAFTPLAEEAGNPSGFMIAGRFWDRVFMTNLGDAAGALIQSIPLSELNARQSGLSERSQEYRTTEMGVSALGQPIFAYTATFDLSEEADIIRQNEESNRRIAFCVLAVLLIFFAVLWKWLAYPIRLVSEALENDDPTVLKPILNEDYDWSRIAQRLTESSEARLELTREVRRQEEQVKIQEETARVRESLARDLHDGVIQSVYAVGLQLERANRLAPKDTAKAQDRIEDCKLSLNGIISELRGFIKGLTPEPLRGKNLQDALEQLVIHSRKSTEVQIDVQIDPVACDALSTAQALNFYQLSRELLSNAIRHASASAISLRVAMQADSIVLRVCDNGVGFDPKKVPSGGHGLQNIQDRARQIDGNVEIIPNGQGGVIIHISAPKLDS